MNFNEVINIINIFNFEGDFVSINSNVCGNINDTYVLEFNLKNDKKRYILQRINTDVFGDPKKLMYNITSVDYPFTGNYILYVNGFFSILRI